MMETCCVYVGDGAGDELAGAQRLGTHPLSLWYPGGAGPGIARRASVNALDEGADIVLP